MKFLFELILGLSLLLSGGFATKKIYQKVRKEALKSAQQGLPSLVSYTNKLIK